MTSEERTRRLERRLEREREARRLAEQIGERGMRDLWLANRNLEARVAERTAEVERSIRAVRMASDAKEAFLAQLGHELATPLHAVLGLLELVDRTPLSDEDRTRLDEVGSNARELADLLFGLVELAGAEGAAGPDEIYTLAPINWLDDLTAEWTRRAAARGQLLVPIHRGRSEEIAAPWRRLRQVVDLLLDNAVAYANPGKLHVELDAGAADEELLTCRVADSGPGLDEHQLATAAEPFVRFDERGQLGIGLAVAARLTRAVGGSLSLSNHEGGTTVTIELPCREGSARQGS